MAIRIIRQDDDPVLRKLSKQVDKIDERIHILIDDMIETMYDAEGIGLAAPQIGILKRVIVIDIGEGLIELINPEIVEEAGTQCEVEGCLSLPTESGDVIRPKTVKVKGLDRNGQEVLIEGSGLLARALCHEIDHLNGILFIDRIKDE
ncbi:peptide deformylase [Clostridium formicaceticum]|uniref:Peptide deformylase n=1 Tax=Clostridium formicaceticum TaxID=1497 RepID=A0AAC9RPE8_9CLOT|nr:peptide deformylase [Clostridium formicaceticum]AOY77372.1 peptide deformylase [Clostridium formicaceticum]ARE87920.1 Peptide deformylase [Clostridium formicaceticum]